jgi:hypothetical protein
MDLKVYLATSAACLAVRTFTFVSIVKDIKRELKERGYTVVQEKLTHTNPSIKDYLLALLVDLTPVVRFITPVTLVLLRKILIEATVRYAIETGIAVKIEESTLEEDIQRKKERLLAYKEELAKAKAASYDFEDDSFNDSIGDTPAKGFSH